MYISLEYIFISFNCANSKTVGTNATLKLWGNCRNKGTGGQKDCLLHRSLACGCSGHHFHPCGYENRQLRIPKSTPHPKEKKPNNFRAKCQSWSKKAIFQLWQNSTLQNRDRGRSQINVVQQCWQIAWVVACDATKALHSHPSSQLIRLIFTSITAVSHTGKAFHGSMHVHHGVWDGSMRLWALYTLVCRASVCLRAGSRAVNTCIWSIHIAKLISQLILRLNVQDCPSRLSVSVQKSVCQGKLKTLAVSDP